MLQEMTDVAELDVNIKTKQNVTSIESRRENNTE